MGQDEMESVVRLLDQAKKYMNQLKERFCGLIKSEEEDVCYTLVSEAASCIDRVREKLGCMGATGDDNHHLQPFPIAKRKELPTRSVEVKLSGKGTEAEELYDSDVYQWRKYGQKKILNSMYPRAYYRCKNLHTHKCLAKKQVQRRDDDSRFLHVAYIGVHTCFQEKPKRPKQNPISCHEQQQLDPVNESPFHYQTTATESVAFEAQFLDDISGESYSAPSIASPCLESGFIESFYNPDTFV